MYAVIKTGGKQYRVSEGDLLRIEKISGDIGELIEFDDVLLIAGDEQVDIGRPRLKDSRVIGEIVEHGQGRKILIFKSRRRKGYRKKQGHRQQHTVLRIKEIRA